jgi:undecaprenyl-diphosphatase
MNVIRSIHRFDVSLFMWVASRKTQYQWVKIAKAFSRSANGPIYLLLMLSLAARNHGTDSLFLGSLLLGFALERPIYFILKNLFRRSRPYVALNTQNFVTPGDRFSFPSGHTSAAFLVATVTSSFNPSLAPILFSWACLVGMARVVLGVHFPTDTLIGALMGMGLAFISMEILIQ